QPLGKCDSVLSEHLHRIQNKKIHNHLDCTPDKNVCEHFLGFIPVDFTTGQELTNAILSELKINTIPIQDMRGQGYDNGSNMKFRHFVVFFLYHVHAHTLNLVVNNTAKLSSGTQAKFLFKFKPYFDSILVDGLLMRGSIAKVASLKKYNQNRYWKPLSKTRWESGIFDALYEISQDIYFDQITRLEAESLAKKI
ncbi:zinc finger MYM-type protein 1-like, partial [Aphis craccivora]